MPVEQVSVHFLHRCVGARTAGGVSSGTMVCVTLKSQLQMFTAVSLVTSLMFYMLTFSTMKKEPQLLPNEAKNENRRFYQYSPSFRPQACQCPTNSVNLSNRVSPRHYQDMQRRRTAAFHSHKLRKQSILSTPLRAQANSPLQFPIHGYVVLPLMATVIPGLKLQTETRSSYKVSLEVSNGTLRTRPSEGNAGIQGNGEKEVTITSCSLEEVNDLLASVTYTSTTYRSRGGDIAHFKFEAHHAVFPIVIEQPQVPVLWDSGSDVDSQVTITTKTFLRYDKLQVLLDSVRRYYPHIRVVVADDSMDPQAVSGHNVQHYIMPPGTGWFAGRNLAVSQVTTKYFLWVDDDFLFTKKTKIERFVEIMEANPELDVVGGSVMGNRWAFSLVYEEGQEVEGGCIQMMFKKKFQSLPGYPECFVVNGVVNFFMARTEAVRSVGFDPKIRRVGHPELFMDGLGLLMVASCNDPLRMFVGHQPHNYNSQLYNRFRHPSANYFTYRYPIYFFKNHLKCIRMS